MNSRLYLFYLFCCCLFELCRVFGALLSGIVLLIVVITCCCGFDVVDGWGVYYVSFAVCVCGVCFVFMLCWLAFDLLCLLLLLTCVCSVDVALFYCAFMLFVVFGYVTLFGYCLGVVFCDSVCG